MKDPRTNEVRYVGKSVNFKRRKKDHIRDCPTEENYKARWLRSLLAAGFEPQFEVLEVGGGDWQSAECRWIEDFREAGARLTNVSEGGRMARHGATNTPESKAKTSAKLMGHTVSPETRAKLSAAAKGRQLSDEHKAKLSVPFTGDRKAAHLVKLARVWELNRGRPRSAETKAKLSAIHTGRSYGRKNTPEHIAKLTESRKSPAVRAKMSAGQKAAWARNRESRITTSETRAKLSLAQKAAWARDPERPRKIGARRKDAPEAD